MAEQGGDPIPRSRASPQETQGHGSSGAWGGPQGWRGQPGAGGLTLLWQWGGEIHLLPASSLCDNTVVTGVQPQSLSPGDLLLPAASR